MNIVCVIYKKKKKLYRAIDRAILLRIDRIVDFRNRREEKKNTAYQNRNRVDTSTYYNILYTTQSEKLVLFVL